MITLIELQELIIMKTFHFQFNLNYNYKFHYYQGNLQLASLGLQRKRLIQAQTKEIYKNKEKVCSSLFVLEVVGSRNR